MTSVAVSPIVKNIIRTINKVLQEGASLVDEVKDDLEELKLILTTTQETVVHAEEKQIGDTVSRDWLGELETAAYGAQDVIDSFATETFISKRKEQIAKNPALVNKTKIAYQSTAADDIRKILNEMKSIADKGQKRIAISAGVATDNEISQSSASSRAHIEKTQELDNRFIIQGREDVKEKLISDLLKSDDSIERNVSICPIVGLPGIGKTTLAQLIYNDARIKKHFESARMWIIVSVDFNLKKILQEIIEVYSDMKETKGYSLDTIKSRFQEFLPGKRFLLVLDDVWTDDRFNDWDPLLNLLELGNKGSKLIVTSRRHKVAEILVADKSLHFELDLLSEDECWSLFKSSALNNRRPLSHAKQQELEDIGKEIVTRCQGLPLAVRAMAGLLRGKNDVLSWRNILRNNIWQLGQPHDQNTPQILPVLQLSYDNLPSHLKQCFAFCSIFPKAYAFDKTELVKLWMAEAFIDSSSDDSADDTGATYFDALQERSFFQRIEIDKRERYRMHDLIHDLALSVSRLYCCQVKDESSLDFSIKCQHASFLCQDVDNLCEKAVDTWKNLRTVLLSDTHLRKESLHKLFNSLRFLRVLDLSASTLLELPSSIEGCKLLCYLDLSGTDIKELPNSICKLYNLQTLKLLHCAWLFELPKDLGNLVNLRHLELDEMFWFKCTVLPSKLGSLTKLQNMHRFMLQPKGGYGIEELKDMANLKGTLHISMLENAVNAKEALLAEKEKLQKVVFEWSGRHVDATDQAAHARVLENIRPNSGLEELQISHYGGIDFPPWMSGGVLRNLVKISLHHCTNCNILFLGQQPKLQILHIKGLLELVGWQDQVQFPSLHRLTVTNCPKLRVMPVFFPNLGVLKIKRCNSLQDLPVAPFLKFLILIENFNLENWNDMIPLPPTDGQTMFQPTNVNLLELKISSCPKLARLPRIFAPQKLEISRCDQLSALPNPDFSQRLQHLALDSCNNGILVRTIPDSNSLYSLVISNISNMNFLPVWPRLPGLKSLYIHNCHDLLSLSEGAESLRSLTSLELLSIRGCPNLVKLPNDSLPTSLQCLSIGSCNTLQFLGRHEALSRLTSLKDLYIEDCPLLQSFPESGLPTSLKHLYIRNCPLLTEVCRKEVGSEWRKIMNVPDLELETDSFGACSACLPIGCDRSFCGMSNIFCQLLGCVNPH